MKTTKANEKANGKGKLSVVPKAGNASAPREDTNSRLVCLEHMLYNARLYIGRVICDVSAMVATDECDRQTLMDAISVLDNINELESGVFSFRSYLYETFGELKMPTDASKAANTEAAR